MKPRCSEPGGWIGGAAPPASSRRPITLVQATGHISRSSTHRLNSPDQAIAARPAQFSQPPARPPFARPPPLPPFPARQAPFFEALSRDPVSFLSTAVCEVRLQWRGSASLLGKAGVLGCVGCARARGGGCPASCVRCRGRGCALGKGGVPAGDGGRAQPVSLPNPARRKGHRGRCSRPRLLAHARPSHVRSRVPPLRLRQVLQGRRAWTAAVSAGLSVRLWPERRGSVLWDRTRAEAVSPPPHFSRRREVRGGRARDRPSPLPPSFFFELFLVFFFVCVFFL